MLPPAGIPRRPLKKILKDLDDARAEGNVADAERFEEVA